MFDVGGLQCSDHPNIALVDVGSRHMDHQRLGAWQQTPNSLHLLPERATFCETSLTAGGLAKHRGATAANDHSLRMAEDSGAAAKQFEGHASGTWGR